MSTPTPRRAVVYTRISSDDGSALGVKRQETDCRKLAEQRGWDVVAVFTDNDVSASTGKRRPAYERMLDALRRGDADALVVWDLDRLTRIPRELEDFMDGADRGGWALASVGGDVDLASPQGRLLARVKGSVARHEAEQMSRRIRRKTDERAEAGLPHGKVPYGWRRVVQIDPDGRVHSRDVIDEEQAAVIRDACTRVSGGESVRSIVADLNARGVLSPGGKPWQAVMLRQVLLRERNAGLRRHRGEVVGGGTWEPVLDPIEWERCRAILTDPTRRSSPGREPSWLLSGIARCGRDECHTPMRILRPKPNQQHKYVCPVCYGVSRIAAPVDELVSELVIERLSQPDAATALARPTGPAVDALEDVARLRTRLDDAADAYAAGDLTAAQLTRITGQLRPQLDAAEGRARANLSTPDLADLAGRDARQVWERMPLARRREVVRMLLNVTILPVGRHHGAAPFDPDSVHIAWRTT